MTFAVAACTSKVSRRPCTCPTAGNILILHKPLVGGGPAAIQCFIKINQPDSGANSGGGNNNYSCM